MAYFPDLSRYAYDRFERDAGALNVGWLASEHPFERHVLDEAVIDRLWAFCKVSINQTRGIHLCDFCPKDSSSYYAQRKGEALLLGTSEIRVFGSEGVTYAAPTLIYHYVVDHEYMPPQQFAGALMRGPAPPDTAYFACLDEAGFEWRMTSSPSTLPRIIR